jgi:hypothetical protein
MKKFSIAMNVTLILILSFTACVKDTAIIAQTSIEAVAKYLSTTTGGAVKENPIPLAVKIDLQNMLASDSGWKKLLGAINTAGKYVALDLSACTMPGTEFDPDPSFADGKKFITSLVLPDMVESTAFPMEYVSAFLHFENMTDIPFGKSLITIGSGAFAYLQLTSVIIPNGVTSIGTGAFFNCGLISVTIPDGVVTIGLQAFANNQLTSVIIPNSVTIIERMAFENNQLSSVIIPIGVTTIRESLFRNNQLNSVTIPNSVTIIERMAFVNNQLTDVTIPGGVTTIGESAFANNQLTNVTIPDSVTTIGIGAFENNQMAIVTIPSSVNSIEFAAFDYNQLISITVGADYPFINADFWEMVGNVGGSNGFVRSYNSNGKQAGTYTRSSVELNARWTRQ